MLYVLVLLGASSFLLVGPLLATNLAPNIEADDPTAPPHILAPDDDEDQALAKEEEEKCLEECGLTEDILFSQAEYRSIGSVEAPPYFFPSAVFLSFEMPCDLSAQHLSDDKPKYSHRCSGVLLNHQFLLTAAHCMYINVSALFHQCSGPTMLKGQTNWIPVRESGVRVIIGRQKWAESVEGEYAQQGIEQYFIPDHFKVEDVNQRIPREDVALLKLTDSVNYTSVVKPVCITSDTNGEIWYYGLGQVASWGAKRTNLADKGMHLTDTLQQLTVPILEPDECDRNPALSAQGFSSQKGHLCAGGRNRGILPGDSGAGLLVNYGGRWYAIGVASTLTTLSNNRHVLPDVYTRVSGICRFLKMHMGYDICQPFTALSTRCREFLRDRREKAIGRICEQNTQGVCTFTPLAAVATWWSDRNGTVFFERRCTGCDWEECVAGRCISDICAIMGLRKCGWTRENCLLLCSRNDDDFCKPFNSFPIYGKIRDAGWKKEAAKRKSLYAQLFLAAPNVPCDKRCQDGDCDFQGVCSADGVCMGERTRKFG